MTSVCAKWYEHSGDKWFKEEACRFFNHASYMAEHDGVVQTRHNWGSEIWFSDGYTDYVGHFIEGIESVPEWAPARENYLLRTTSAIQKIKYQDKQILYQTYDIAA
jgi:hypothetical protein